MTSNYWKQKERNAAVMVCLPDSIVNDLSKGKTIRHALLYV